MKILHVAEAWGGGVATAVNDICRVASGYEHHVVYTPRPDSEYPAEAERFADLGRWSIKAAWKMWRIAEDPRWDLVHAHSSIAGALLRLLGSRRLRSRLVYSPHCYAFERLDVSRVKRHLYWLVEKSLGGRSAAVACVSPREVQLARALSGRPKIVYIPHPIHIAEVDARSAAARDCGRPTVVTAGRLCAQKDPAFFAATVREFRTIQPATDVRWVWVGDGASRYKKPLVQAGVEVTGWRARPEVLATLRDASIYFHSAAWEGAPLTIYEATASGVPVVARDIPSLASLGIPRLVQSPKEAALEICARIGRPGGPFTQDDLEWRNTIARDHAETATSEALDDLYEVGKVS